jgi:hypothetical protein
MASYGPPESGTLLIATLLLLGLAFAGSWIVAYVQPGSDPWAIVPWFLAAAALIVVVGLIFILRRGRT